MDYVRPSQAVNVSPGKFFQKERLIFKIAFMNPIMVERTLLHLFFPVGLALALGLESRAAAGNQSNWVHLDAGGKLAYEPLPAGDRILDFSHAGYGGGGVKLPVVAVQKTVAPSGNDDSAAIQTAIDAVAALPVKDGFRGAVLLAAGTFHCSKPIAISQDGIVLRGAGATPNGTVIEMTGAPHVCFGIEGDRLSFPRENPATTFPITDAYVPSGASSLSVKNAGGLAVGDNVLIRWLRSAEWIHFMGMDTLVRNGKQQTWMKNDSPVTFERTIRAIQGNRLTLDVPLTDAINSRFGMANDAVVIKITHPKRLMHCGLEALQINSPPPSGTLTAPNNTAVTLNNCEDCWVKDLAMHDTLNIVRVLAGARRITLESVHANHTASVEKGAGYPADFSLIGSQILVDRCSSSGDGAFFVATMNSEAVLNVALNCLFKGKGGIQPHMHWSTGLLIDNCVLPDGKIDFINRGTAGSGHGWAIGWAVAWNCKATSLNVQQPPGSVNWCIGCTGELDWGKLKKGEAPPKPGPWLSSHNSPVEPGSLYLAQLRERLGPQALANIGY